MRYLKTNSKLAFTLIELLTVIAVIGVLASILIVASGRALDSARQSQCSSNLRGLAIMLRTYANDHKGILPVTDRGGSGTPSNWVVALLDGGYLNDGQSNTLRAFGENQGKSILYCPSAISVAPPLDGNWNTYAMNVQVGGWYQSAGMAPASRLVRVENPAGTVLISDGCRQGQYYLTGVGRPGVFPEPVHPDRAFDPDTATGGGANVAFVDGHVEYRESDQIPSDVTDLFWSGVNP
jgi:prepilin-type N-terminal cleavage/methylation domain-containing protein/prepilin-type processing-associated H-X9-DG protein